MGHSYVCYGERCTHERDEDLIILRHFIEREGVALLEGLGQPQPLTADFRRFLGSFVQLGPGVFQAGFDELLNAGPQRRQFLIAVLDRVHQAYESIGAAIPQAYIARHINPISDIIFNADVDTAPLSKSLKRVRGLLE